MTSKIILAALFVVTVSVVTSQTVFAYESQTGKTLEQYLANEKLAKKAVEIASSNKGAGSGTPYFAADGVLGASTIAASIFGGIAATFFVRGKQGRYAAQGHG